MVVSSTSMKVATDNRTAITHGLIGTVRTAGKPNAASDGEPRRAHPPQPSYYRVITAR